MPSSPRSTPADRGGRPPRPARPPAPSPGCRWKATPSLRWPRTTPARSRRRCCPRWGRGLSRSSRSSAISCAASTRSRTRPSRGKESIALDLKTPEGREILYRIIAKADALMQNFRRNTWKNLGLEYEDVQKVTPRLVYLFAASYGSKGPQATMPAFHPTVSAIAGAGRSHVRRRQPAHGLDAGGPRRRDLRRHRAPPRPPGAAAHR